MASETRGGVAAPALSLCPSNTCSAGNVYLNAEVLNLCSPLVCNNAKTWLNRECYRYGYSEDTHFSHYHSASDVL